MYIEVESSIFFIHVISVNMQVTAVIPVLSAGLLQVWFNPCEMFVSKKILGQGNGRDAVLIFVFVVYGFFFLGVVAKRAWACKSMDRRMRWNRDVSVNVF